MISPNDYVLNSDHFTRGLRCNLAYSSVLIKSCEGTEVFGGNVRCISRANQSIGVCWVSYYNDSCGWLCNSIEDLALRSKNCGICLEQISSIHTRTSWSSSYQDCKVSIFKAHFWICSRNYAVNKRVGTVIQLQDDAIENVLSLGQFEQLEDHPLVWTKHITLSDKMIQIAANLASCSSHGYSHRFYTIINHLIVSFESICF